MKYTEYFKEAATADGGRQAIKATLYYVTGKGIKLMVTPVFIRDEDGYSFEETPMFSGFITYVAFVKRYSAKKFDEVCERVRPLLPEVIDAYDADRKAQASRGSVVYDASEHVCGLAKKLFA